MRLITKQILREEAMRIYGKPMDDSYSIMSVCHECNDAAPALVEFENKWQTTETELCRVCLQRALDLFQKDMK